MAFLDARGWLFQFCCRFVSALPRVQVSMMFGMQPRLAMIQRGCSSTPERLAQVTAVQA